MLFKVAFEAQFSHIDSIKMWFEPFKNTHRVVWIYYKCCSDNSYGCISGDTNCDYY